jgi:hypothetical protein
MEPTGAARELVCMDAYKTFRDAFVDLLLEHAQTQTNRDLSIEERDVIRSENTKIIAEWFYAMHAYNVPRDAPYIREYVRMHNEKIDNFIRDFSKFYKETGITKAVIEDCKIGARPTEYLISSSKYIGRSTYMVVNLNTLGSLLIDQMSKQTCRNYIKRLSDMKIVSLEENNGVSVNTNGIIEEIYKKSLSKMAFVIYEQASGVADKLGVV